MLFLCFPHSNLHICKRIFLNKQLYHVKPYLKHFHILTMIQVTFYIQTNNATKVKRIQFSKNHEKNLNTLYGRTKESMARQEKSNLEQFLMICCFFLVKAIRQKTITHTIKDKLVSEFSSRHTKPILRDIKNMSIEAKVDNIPKTVLHFTP